ncbi:MAG: hypothetical protein ACI9C4_002397, partial [Paraglaciecola sp.]
MKDNLWQNFFLISPHKPIPMIKRGYLAVFQL